MTYKTKLQQVLLLAHEPQKPNPQILHLILQNKLNFKSSFDNLILRKLSQTFLLMIQKSTPFLAKFQEPLANKD